MDIDCTAVDETLSKLPNVKAPGPLKPPTVPATDTDGAVQVQNLTRNAFLVTGTDLI